MAKGMGAYKHLKNGDANETKFAIIENQLLTLYKSGVYLSNHDIIQVGKAIEIELPYKNRELVFKMLLAEADKSDKITELMGALLGLLKSRRQSYMALGDNFPRLVPTIKMWLTKLNAMESLLQQQTRMNPYG